jgi:hypothetical protein
LSSPAFFVKAGLLAFFGSSLSQPCGRRLYWVAVSYPFGHVERVLSMNALPRIAASAAILPLLWMSVLASAAEEPTDTIYAGDTVTVVKDSVELGLKDKPAITLNTGDTVRVTEVRGSWIGGYAMKDNQRFTGWVHRDEVKLVVIPVDKAPRIEVPDVADDPKAVAALKELQVKLDLNDKGNVFSADGTESKIEDAGMVHFQGLHQLANLDLSSRPITDAGLKSLGKSTALQELYLFDAKITDAGFAQVKEFPNLEVVGVSGTQVTGAGLVHVKGLKNLRVLSLSKCDIKDDGLAHLEKMPILGVLSLDGTKVTDAGLAHLKSLPDLRVLNLKGCNVDDQGLEQLYGLEELRMLYVGGTKVTEEGKKKFKEAAPSLAIFED